MIDQSSPLLPAAVSQHRETLPRAEKIILEGLFAARPQDREVSPYSQAQLQLAANYLALNKSPTITNRVKEHLPEDLVHLIEQVAQNPDDTFTLLTSPGCRKLLVTESKIAVIEQFHQKPEGDFRPLPAAFADIACDLYLSTTIVPSDRLFAALLQSSPSYQRDFLSQDPQAHTRRLPAQILLPLLSNITQYQEAIPESAVAHIRAAAVPEHLALGGFHTHADLCRKVLARTDLSSQEILHRVQLLTGNITPEAYAAHLELRDQLLERYDNSPVTARDLLQSFRSKEGDPFDDLSLDDIRIACHLPKTANGRAILAELRALSPSHSPESILRQDFTDAVSAALAGEQRPITLATDDLKRLHAALPSHYGERMDVLARKLVAHGFVSKELFAIDGPPGDYHYYCTPSIVGDYWAGTNLTVLGEYYSSENQTIPTAVALNGLGAKSLLKGVTCLISSQIAATNHLDASSDSNDKAHWFKSDERDWNAELQEYLEEIPKFTLDTIPAARTIPMELRQGNGITASDTPMDLARILVARGSITPLLPPTITLPQPASNSLYFSPAIVGVAASRANLATYIDQRYGPDYDLKAMNHPDLILCSRVLRCPPRLNDVSKALLPLLESGGTGTSAPSRSAEKVPHPKQFSSYSDTALATFISDSDLEPIISAFGGSPSLLMTMLQELRGSAFKEQSVADFTVRYYLTAGGPGAKAPSLPESSAAYGALLGASLSSGNLSYHQVLATVIDLSREAWYRDADSFYRNLEDAQSGLGAAGDAADTLRAIYHATGAYFREIDALALTGVRSQPFAFQREGIHFLMTHDRAILADEVGLGKTFQVAAALQTLGIEKTLWVTTASNRSVVRDELLKHTELREEQILLIGEESRAERAKHIRTGLPEARVIIVGYETLVALKEDKGPSLNALTWNLDCLVVDESHKIDNEDSLRSQAVRDIQAPRLMLLTASLYQNGPDRLDTTLNFVRPDLFPLNPEFRQRYISPTDGIGRLRDDLSEVMLRRSKNQVAQQFNPSIPARDQLGSGQVLLPQKIRVNPYVRDTFAITAEQTAASLEALSLQGASAAWNSFDQMHALHTILYNPASQGLPENPVFLDTVTAVAKEYLDADKKVIIWAWNKAVIADITAALADYGALPFTGESSMAVRADTRARFQHDPSCQVLVANITAGGVGLTLTAASAAIFAQLPQTWSEFYQAEGRSHRLLGAKDGSFAKHTIDTRIILPVYDHEAITPTMTARVQQSVQAGTLIEQRFARLQRAEILYNLLLEGVADPTLVKHYEQGMF